MPTEQVDTPAPKRAWGRWLALGLLLAVIGASYFFGLNDFLWDGIRSNLGDFKAQVEENLLLSALGFFVLYTLMTALSVPAAWILTLLAGALFGRVLGTGLALVAATLGATLAFLSSRYLFRAWVQEQWGSRLGAFNRGVEKDGAFYLFSLRLVPLFPFFLVNLGMGLTPIRTWTYFWVSLIGMLPGSFLYTNAGRTLATLESTSDLLSTEVIVSLALLGAAPLVLRKAMDWLSRARG